MMVSESEVIRLQSIESRLNIIYGLEINPMLSELLDQLAIDVDWLCQRLESAWSAVEAYQEELRYFYE
jgi:hypothetical protein